MPDSRGDVRPYQTEVDFAFRLFDMVWITVALWITTVVFGEPWQNAQSLASVAASLLFYLFAEASGLYRPLRGEPVREELTRLITAWSAAVTVLLLAGFLTKTSAVYSRKTMTAWALFA